MPAPLPPRRSSPSHHGAAVEGRVRNRSLGELWGSLVQVWSQEPQTCPCWGLSSQHLRPPSPARGCPAPPSTGTSFPHQHQGKPTPLLTGGICALFTLALGKGTCTQLTFKL